MDIVYAKAAQGGHEMLNRGNGTAVATQGSRKTGGRHRIGRGPYGGSGAFGRADMKHYARILGCRTKRYPRLLPAVQPYAGTLNPPHYGCLTHAYLRLPGLMQKTFHMLYIYILPEYILYFFSCVMLPCFLAHSA
jgi:hypothetical protein